MNATWTLNNFPQVWRNRYEADFHDALDSFPATSLDTFDLLVGAATAHLRLNPAWTASESPTPRSQEAPDPVRSASPPSLLGKVLLGSHVTRFIVVNALLIGLNLLITPQNLWSPYALWGWSIAHAVATVTASHAGPRPGNR